MSDEIHDYLISTFYGFSHREVVVYIQHDGMSYWTETTRMNELYAANPGYKLLACVDDSAKRHVEHMADEFCIEAIVPESAMIEIRKMEPHYWSDDPKDLWDDKLLDSFLLPIFWEHIAPKLSPPCMPSENVA